MLSIEEFATNWNGRGTVKLPHDDEVIDWYTEKCTEAYLDVFVHEREMRYPRVSAMGYPLLKHAILKFMPYTDSAAGRASFHFWQGHVIEAMVLALMYTSGVDVHSLQSIVNFEGMKGHIDGIAGDDIVFDVKSMSRSYFERWKRGELDNDRGYLTQLSIYWYETGCEKASIVAVDKWFGEMAIVPVSDIVDLEKYYYDAVKDAAVLNSTQSLEDAVRNIAPPEPIVDRRESTRFRVVPKSVEYGIWKNIFYEMKSEKLVRRVLSPDEILMRIAGSPPISQD